MMSHGVTSSASKFTLGPSCSTYGPVVTSGRGLCKMVVVILDLNSYFMSNTN